MKKCASCAKDLPDTALHCVFCGTKQPVAAPTDPEAGSAKTVMGFSAAELARNLPPGANVGGPPRPMAPPPAQMPMQPPMAPMPMPQQPMAPPMAPMPMPQQPMAPPPMAMPPPMAPMPMAPQPLPPTMNAQPPAASAKTQFAQPSPFLQQPPPPQPMPMPMQQPQPMSPMAMPMQPPSPMAPPPMAPPPAAPRPARDTAQVSPVAAPTPPYLASQTAARMGRPIDAFAGGMQTVLLVFGILLVVGFCTPVVLKPDLVFRWKGLFDQPAKLLVVTVIWVAAGVIGALFGAIPVKSMVRGAAGAALGLIALLYPAVALQQGDFQWQLPVSVVGAACLPAGLLLRDAYRAASLGRVLATIGAVAVLAVFLIPSHGAIELTDKVIKEITDGDGWRAKLFGVIDLLPFVIAVLALLSWIPGPSGAGAKIFAWLWILLPVIDHFTHVIVAGHIGAALKHSPFDVFFGEGGVISAAYIAFAGYGLATLLGKNLEQR